MPCAAGEGETSTERKHGEGAEAEREFEDDFLGEDEYELNEDLRNRDDSPGRRRNRRFGKENTMTDTQLLPSIIRNTEML